MGARAAAPGADWDWVAVVEPVPVTADLGWVEPAMEGSALRDGAVGARAMAARG